jgi:adenosine deaminase
MVAGRKLTKPLAELHFHLGTSLEPAILWSLAHEQGIRLPSKDFWEFNDMITLNKDSVTWEDYHKMFHWTELIQSSPRAMERTLYEAITGAYRVNNITLSEPLFNPIYRNRGGEQDLDQIILAALRGMERALIEFPNVKAGLILALDRRLPFEVNSVIVKKAIKYSGRGIVGIDIAGPNKEGFQYADYAKLYKEAREAGLRTTVHTGEEGSPEEMAHVLDVLDLDRINHGIKAAFDKEVMKKVRERDLTLCICPTSNLVLNLVDGIEGFRFVIRTLYDNGVKFCFNTDNPVMLKTNLIKEIEIIRKNAILNEEEIDQTIQWAFDASFINVKTPHENLYL